MTVKVADLAKELLPWAPGCPGPLARRELLRAAQKFCRDTHAIRVETPDFTLPANNGELDLNSYTGLLLKAVRLVSAKVNNWPLGATTELAVANLPGSATTPSAGDIRLFYQRSENIVRTFPYPDSARTMSMVIAVMPTDTATTVPINLGTQWRDAVVGGALKSICLIPGQPYTSQEQAMRGASMYAQGVNLARIEANRSNGAEISVRMRAFV